MSFSTFKGISRKRCKGATAPEPRPVVQNRKWGVEIVGYGSSKLSQAENGHNRINDWRGERQRLGSCSRATR